MQNRPRSRWRGPWVFTSPAAAGATAYAAKRCPEAGASGFLTRGAETVLSGAIECSRRVYVRLRSESSSRGVEKQTTGRPGLAPIPCHIHEVRYSGGRVV